jgi:hypothetical protein
MKKDYDKINFMDILNYLTKEIKLILAKNNIFIKHLEKEAINFFTSEIIKISVDNLNLNGCRIDK